MFDKLKNIYELQKQARELKKALADEIIEVEGFDGLILVTITGEMKIMKVAIKEEAYADHARLEDEIQKTVNKAIETAQKIAAEQMQKMGGFGALMGGAK